MKTLRPLVFACFAVGCCTPANADDAQPALYSFTDVYRLTVNAAPDAQDSFVAAEPRFTVSQVPGPKGWMLVLAGLAAAGWVAHRRLTSGY